MSDAKLKAMFSSGTTPSAAGNPSTGDASEIMPEMAPNAVIRVIGVGGGGGNALNRMVEVGIEGVEFISVNTDAQTLFHSQAKKKINIGRGITRGLGAGADPQQGRSSAEESSEELKNAIEGTDMLFITCGMGGGTGTGAAPIIADIARDLGVLTVAVVTRPFGFEGSARRKRAEEGLEELAERVDTIITIPNDRILSIIDKKTPITDSFGIVDDVLRQGIQGISELITQHGLINVDFADVKSVMKNSGSSLMGIGFGSGESRAADAARAAVESPLLEMSIDGAKGILFNITGGHDMSMFEVEEAARAITEAADPEANIIFGAVVNEKYTGEIKITVIATGFERQLSPPASPLGGGANMANAAASGADTPDAAAQQEDGDDLEVPAFLRRPVGKDGH